MTTETGRPAAPVSLTYVPQLDGLRGFAVLLVVIYHSGYLDGRVGPEAASRGFHRRRPVLRAQRLPHHHDPARPARTARPHQTGASSGRDAFAGSCPALVFAVVGVAVLIVLFNDKVDFDALRNSTIGSVLFVSNWEQAAGWRYQFELSHTWSLAVEAQFYLVWPIVLIVMSKLHVPRRVFAGLVRRSRQSRSACTAGACGPTRRTSCRSTSAPTPAPT